MWDLKAAVNDVDHPIRDYVNPKSAMTLGACAAMVLAFTTSLCSAFPILPAALVALALSFMFGIAQVAYLDEKVGMKVIYGVVCALIIFNSARGGNLAINDVSGGKVVVPPASITVPSTAPEPVKTSMSFGDLTASAYGGDEVAPQTGKPASTNRNAKTGSGKFHYWRTTDDGKAVYTNFEGQVYTNPVPAKNKGFFKEWKWVTE